MLRILAFFAITASANLAGADCAMVTYNPNVLTPTGTNLGDRGGVVVAQLAHTQAPKLAPTTWKFKAAGASTAPVVAAIAPGLDVYRPATRGAKLVLVEGATTVVEIGATGAVRALPAPAIASATFASSRGRHSWTSVTAELAGDPPEGAVALVVFDKAGTPRSFGTAVRNAKQLVVYSHSDCGGPFNGTLASAAGDEIRLAWLDAAGMLSPQTEPIKVR